METTKITSAQNPIIKKFSTFNRRKTPELICLDGVHLHLEYLKSCGENPEITLVSEKFKHSTDWQNFKGRDNLIEIPDGLMTKLSPSQSPAGILSLAAKPTGPKATQKNLIIILESIQDPGNLGSMLRTSLAMGAAEVLLLGSSADIWSEKTLRAGMGAQFYLPIRPLKNLQTWKETFNGPLIGTSLQGESSWNTRLPLKSALIFGNEGQGLTPESKKMCDKALKIPMHKNTESLNVASSLAILTHEWARQNQG
jgi:TrmH family RNA methyltransferase